MRSRPRRRPRVFGYGPLEELRERPRDLHALDAATTEDVPAAFPEDDLRFEEWLEGTFGEPDLDWEGSQVVFAGERPVAFTLLNVDREACRAENDMTGTLAEFRGRGLARLVKLSSLVSAAENGIEYVSTGNDASNAAMLAMNRRLGYRERAVRAWLVKELQSPYQNEALCRRAALDGSSRVLGRAVHACASIYHHYAASLRGNWTRKRAPLRRSVILIGALVFAPWTS